ncbi:MAG: hypothetical protein FWG98_00705 [Candidatus Cloacimonetes bacterium]|nr:hypothetical protein [Candidatus Cloacimonadota bacterium]
MNYSEIAFKIINHIIKLAPYQAVTISAEIHNVYDFNEPLAEIPFLEELAIVVRKKKGLPIIDISTENMHKRFFEEVTEDNQNLSTELLNKWLSMSEIFIDLSWRSNPIFYRSIPERSFKRLNILPKDFVKLFEDNNKKLILLGFPTIGLANYLDIDHDLLKKGYFSSLNIDYFDLKKRCYILDNRMNLSENWNITTENRLLKMTLFGESKVYCGEFHQTHIMTLPTGCWQKAVKIDSIDGIFYCDNVFHEQYNWKNIQLIIEQGKIIDVETDVQQPNLNLLKSILFYDADSVVLNIGLNKTSEPKTHYSLFDMVRNRNLSLIIVSQKGQVIALSEKAGLLGVNDYNVLSSCDL